MKEKRIYESPLAELYKIRLEEGLLTGSVEAMNTITGSWEEE